MTRKTKIVVNLSSIKGNLVENNNITILFVDLIFLSISGNSSLCIDGYA